MKAVDFGDMAVVRRELDGLARAHENTIRYLIDLASMRIADVPLSVMGKLGAAANLVMEAKNEYEQSGKKDTSSTSDQPTSSAH